MTDEELEMFQKMGCLVAALETIAECGCNDVDHCRQIARDALMILNKSDN